MEEEQMEKRDDVPMIPCPTSAAVSSHQTREIKCPHIGNVNVTIQVCFLIYIFIYVLLMSNLFFLFLGKSTFLTVIHIKFCTVHFGCFFFKYSFIYLEDYCPFELHLLFFMFSLEKDVHVQTCVQDVSLWKSIILSIYVCEGVFKSRQTSGGDLLLS